MHIGNPQLEYVLSTTYDQRSFVPKRFIHKHSIAQIRLVTDGCLNFWQNNKYYFAREGDLVISNAGDYHAEHILWHSITFFTIAVSHLNLPGLPVNHLVPDGLSPCLSTGKDYNTLLALVRLLHEYWNVKERELEGSDVCFHALFLLLHKINYLIYNRGIEEATGQSSGDLCLLIKDYIQANYTADISLEAIGSALHISSSLISHIFKKEFGVSPMQYVTNLRLGESQTHLILTDESITSIASNIGYNTPGNFNAMFKKYVNSSPTQYRKKMKNDNESY